jgi:Cysteine dioxygenase type I
MAYSTEDLADEEQPRSVEPVRLARLVHPSDRRQRLSETDLLHLVEELCEQVTTEGPVLGSTDGRRYKPPFRTESVEAWIIAWPSSAFVGLHDHGQSRGAYQVVQGRLREISTDLIRRGPLTTRQLRPGLCVHMYSPPLRSMNFYSDEPSSYLAELRTETEVEWPDPDRWAERAVGLSRDARALDRSSPTFGLTTANPARPAQTALRVAR